MSTLDHKAISATFYLDSKKKKNRDLSVSFEPEIFIER